MDLLSCYDSHSDGEEECIAINNDLVDTEEEDESNSGSEEEEDDFVRPWNTNSTKCYTTNVETSTKSTGTVGGGDSDSSISPAARPTKRIRIVLNKEVDSDGLDDAGEDITSNDSNGAEFDQDVETEDGSVNEHSNDDKSSSSCVESKGYISSDDLSDGDEGRQDKVDVEEVAADKFEKFFPKNHVEKLTLRGDSLAEKLFQIKPERQRRVKSKVDLLRRCLAIGLANVSPSTADYSRFSFLVSKSSKIVKLIEKKLKEWTPNLMTQVLIMRHSKWHETSKLEQGLEIIRCFAVESKLSEWEIIENYAFDIRFNKKKMTIKTSFHKVVDKSKFPKMLLKMHNCFQVHILSITGKGTGSSLLAYMTSLCIAALDAEL